MNKKFLYLGFGLFTFLIGVGLATLLPEYQASRQVRSDPVVARTEQEDSIAEALFRHLLQEHQGFEVYFLSRDGIDPTDDFMRRFQGEVPLKKKRSRSKPGQYRRILDKETGAIGGIVTVGFIKWLSASEVEISGGFYDGEIIVNKYRLTQTAGWIVRTSEFVMES